MLFVIKSFFFLLFNHPSSQANAYTPISALSVSHVGKKREKTIQNIKQMLVSSLVVKCWDCWANVQRWYMLGFWKCVSE